MLEKLLSKDDKRKYNLLYFLERSDAHFLEKTELKEKLAISDFLLKKTLEQVNEDCQAFSVYQQYGLVASESSIRLETDGSVNCHFFLNQYLRDSTSVLLLREILFDSISSINDFATKHYLSYPKVYKLLKELRVFLKSYDLTIDKKMRFVGNEMATRTFFVELFSKIYHNNLSIYPGIDSEIINYRISLYQQDIYGELSVSDEIMMKHFLYINYLRMSHHHFLETNELFEEFHGLLAAHLEVVEKYKALFSFHTNTQQVQAEVIYLILWLGTKNILPREDMKIIRQLKGVEELTETFIEAVMSVFFVESELNILDDKFLYNLYAIHLSLYLMTPSFNSFVYEMDVSYFKDNYPEFFYFCQKYIADMKEKNKRIWDFRLVIFYHYLFLLCSFLPSDRYLVPIHLYIDFSFGKAYNQLIGNNLHFFKSLGVEISYSFSEEIDIILTDSAYLDRGHNMEKVLWLSPPNPIDWVNLSEKIVARRNNKVQDVLDLIRDKSFQ